jgi:hypothetical protein
VPVRQTTGARPVHLALAGRRGGAADGSEGDQLPEDVDTLRRRRMVIAECEARAAREAELAAAKAGLVSKTLEIES